MLVISYLPIIFYILKCFINTSMLILYIYSTFVFFFFFKMQPNRKVTTVPFRKTLLGKHTRNETSK